MFDNYSTSLRKEIKDDLYIIESLSIYISSCLFIKCKFREYIQQGRSDNWYDYTHSYIFSPSELIVNIVSKVIVGSSQINSHSIRFVEREAEFQKAYQLKNELQTRIEKEILVDYIQNGKTGLEYFSGEVLSDLNCTIGILNNKPPLYYSKLLNDYNDYIEFCSKEFSEFNEYNFEGQKLIAYNKGDITLKNIRDSLFDINCLFRI